MNLNRRQAGAVALAALAWAGAARARAGAPAAPRTEAVLRRWYDLALKLVRHTPTYSPPVASRAFAYLGITAFEAVATGTPMLQSLAGQLNGLQPVPQRVHGAAYYGPAVMHAALGHAARSLFANTGPTGQRVMAKLEQNLSAKIAAEVPAGVVALSEAHGRAVAEHVLNWSRGDGGAAIANLGFPQQYELKADKAAWAPTSLVALQQKPLLPEWGKNRTFAMPDGGACPLPAPPAYSEDTASEFYKQALEVHDTKQNLSLEQRAIARFWSDDPMLSPTPPGHWISIALQVLERDRWGLEGTVEVLARLGVALADAFIACWRVKFEYDLLRPVTYIRRTIDPKWDSAMTTPPFPEYPSGHSTQSAAAAAVLTRAFGGNYAFEDATHARDGLKPRAFPSFWAAAEEAGISRLYGGIHFRAAIERGLEQGRCVGAYANALRTRR